MTSVLRGGLFGLLNTLIVGLLVGATCWSASFAVLVIMFGFVPGVITGSVVGALAAALARQPTWLRNIAILVPAHVVLLSVAMFGPLAYGLAIVPTTFLALKLEEQTRRERIVIPRAIAMTGAY